MLPDHPVVDCAYGGRFQGRRGRNYILEIGRAWDILADGDPTTSD